MDLIKEIDLLKKTKNAVILAHYYTDPNVQEIADFTGDSLALSQMAAKTQADIIVFAGVHFMAETAKIISPDKKVLLPDLNSGCSLADSCRADDFAEFLKNYPDHIVISYVNTTAEVKSLSHVICTSSNAKQIVESFPENQKIVFGPDKNLGDYINKITGRQMVLWNGACHVHNEFSVEKIIKLKNEHIDALVIAHPECQKPILQISDYIGSTKDLLNFTIHSEKTKFIVATESGILYQMKISSPNKIFIPAPGENDLCDCNDCQFMKLNNLEKIYSCLLNESNEILLSQGTIEKAKRPIIKMLEISSNVNK